MKRYVARETVSVVERGAVKRQVQVNQPKQWNEP